MRVTNHMLSAKVLQNLTKSLQEFQRINNQMSSGNAVSKPSDDPVATGRILSLKSSLTAQERYYGNMNDAESFLTTTDDALDNFSESLLRVRTLMLEGGSGSVSSSDRKAIASEIDQVIDQMVEIGNSMCGSQYIFGGHSTLDKPFTRQGDEITYKGDSGEISYEIGRGVLLAVNIDGNQLSQIVEEGLGNTELFNTLIEIKNSLNEDKNIEDLTGEKLSQLDELSDNVLSLRAVVGAKENRIEMSKARNEGDRLEITKVLSHMEDIDIAQAAMEYSEKAYVYQAALATASQMLTISLVDYIAR
ncbi:MAG: flagellar hook-associated protein FlgL [Syntrophaceticus sp.]|nr:flagellar hook-associated protein FlgL [Syntrophaceticus sp.]